MGYELRGKYLLFEIRIFLNSINKVIYTENGEFLFDLQFPPIFRTNFLINYSKSFNKLKKNKNDFEYFENLFFPFRNFEDEISNLKYRHFYILIKKENDIENNDVYDTIDELQKYLGNIFTNKNGNINFIRK